MNDIKLLYGVGLNDWPHSIHKTHIVNGSKKTLWMCPFYKSWTRILQRCYSAKFHNIQPTYIGCRVSDEWLNFSNFRSWMHDRKWHGMAIDKDILIPGNKIYSADTCVFVSKALNQFLVDRGRFRGEWPIGVSWNKEKRKFKSSCNNPFSGKYESLGYFDCPNDAHKSWRKRKHQLACIYADLQSDPRIAKALRSRFSENKDYSDAAN